jgi:hypothetical protein
MRFCPFCSHENTVETVSCAACGRRLPPLPQRRAKIAPPSGPGPAAPSTPVVAEQAAAPVAATPVSVAPVSAPVPATPAAVAPVVVTPELPPASPVVAPPPIAAIAATASPAPVPVAPPPPPPSLSPPPPAADDDRGSRAMPIPAPTALRRQAAPPDERPAGAEARRASDVAPTPQPAASEPVPVAPTPSPGPSEPAAAAPPPPPAIASAEPTALPDATSIAPPPTRIARPAEHVDRPFSPPQVMPLPDVPEPGMMNYGRYAVAFARARWQRRRAVKLLQAEIKSDTDALDVVLSTLGTEARALGVDNHVLAAENRAISEAQHRQADIGSQATEIGQRKAEEVARFEVIERERTIKLTETEKIRDDAERELEVCEAQRRGLRDKRKEVERRQKGYHQAAEQRDTEAGNAPLGEVRSELRKIAEGHRAEAAALEPEKQQYDRKLGELERPLAAAQAKLAAARSEVDLAKRSLADAREGHRHRLAEFEAELGRKLRERDNAAGEVARRLVTLGTLINLHRVERPEFVELYGRIDRLRDAIAARTTEIDHLTAEREAFDRGSLNRGYAVLAGVVLAVITVIVILIAIF